MRQSTATGARPAARSAAQACANLSAAASPPRSARVECQSKALRHVASTITRPLEPARVNVTTPSSGPPGRIVTYAPGALPQAPPVHLRRPDGFALWTPNTHVCLHPSQFVPPRPPASRVSGFRALPYSRERPGEELPSAPRRSYRVAKLWRPYRTTASCSRPASRTLGRRRGTSCRSRRLRRRWGSRP
jgi:hypothetical protein